MYEYSYAFVPIGLLLHLLQGQNVYKPNYFNNSFFSFVSLMRLLFYVNAHFCCCYYFNLIARFAPSINLCFVITHLRFSQFCKTQK